MTMIAVVEEDMVMYVTMMKLTVEAENNFLEVYDDQ